MTACGRATLSNTLGRFTVELQSLNRKYLDLSMQLPVELQGFEVEIKKWVSTALTRGQVALKLSASFEAGAPLSVKPNLPYVKKLVAAWDAIAHEINLTVDNALKMQILAKQEGVLLFENTALDDEAMRAALHNVVNMALEKLLRMKEAEGRALQEDISLRLVKLQKLIEIIAAKAPEAVDRYRVKLKGRIEELLTESSDNHERILREVSLYADRVDIAEEVARFRSHLDQFKGFLEGTTHDVGKTLDFIVQEMKREANTIGAKSLEIEIAQLVIEVKTEVERIREQIQNIE